VHEGRAGDPAPVDVDQRVDLTRFGIATNERGGAIEAIFLAFVEQQRDGPRRRRCFQDCADLEQCRDADPVVASAGTRWRAVVMRTHQQVTSR